MINNTALRHGLLAATSALVLSLPVAASAQDRVAPVVSVSGPASASVADFSVAPDRDPDIITRDDISPNVTAPAGSLDSGVTGVGQMAVRANPATLGLGLCTGTLINPRTVIFAAHCVNTRAAASYGQPTGGVPISFGFNADNRPALLQWLGLNGGTLYASNPALNIYNVEDVWYDPRSLDLGPGLGFLQADIAIATLDTPAFDIPTWAMLFTPLDGQEHTTIVGYGGRGTNASGNIGIDFRRRIAENYVSFLGSLDDLDEGIGFGSSGQLPQNLYFTGFTDPSGVYDVNQLKLDFGIFGPGDTSLPREGTTAGGDSGGPLVLDEKYDKDVILGVLSGGGSIFGAAAFGDAYGSYSFYQPLHAFWQIIVANNPYVYATTKGQDGQWTDPDHWIQAMDPNYLVALDGELINRLPDAPGAEISADGAKYGEVCGIELVFPFPKAGCTEFEQDAIVGATGPQFFVEGGPGTENFVPNNITANPQQGIRPRYFDVTLSSGKTTLSGADIEIDRLTLDGPAILDIKRQAALRSLGDFTQIAGWTNIDGFLSANEAFQLTGLITGTGTLRAPFFTSVAGVVAPGGADQIGTLTIDGNAIFASGAALFIDAGRAGADKLSVTGTLSLSDPNDIAGTGASLVFNKAKGAAPRHGQSFTIASAAGGIEGQFAKVYSFQGVLRPELTYTSDSINAELRAGALVEIIGGNDPTARAFAKALDTLRDGSYDALYNLYGSIDLMDGAALTRALSSLAPRSPEQGRQLFERQGNTLFGSVTDRLSMMGTQGSGTLSVVGAPLGAIDRDGMSRATQLAQAGFAGLAPDRQQVALPEGISGFVTGGVFGAKDLSFSGDRIEDGARSTYIGMGLEHEVARDFVVGVAAGHASGLSANGNDQARSRLDQASVYGSYKLGGAAYVGFAANMEQAKIRTNRTGFGAEGGVGLFGQQDASRMIALTEAGVNLGVTQGLTLTPRVQLGYSRTKLSNLNELGGEAALAIDDITTQRVDAKLGLKLAGSQSLGNGWTFVPQIQADYVRLLDGANSGLDVRFAAADHVTISLPFANGDSNWGELKGGLAISKGPVKFGAGVETSVGRSELRNDRAVVDMTFRF
ncbi:hypothetical protein A9995_11720 [Erythrobacter sp. QSSC1-22B]|uniref:autotransporter outer membrane beta-barrel domain-containing protein n=1 Tax=Erythrobacter sp. QSSC1-22B TaxID=1860125 RepID=UPI0008057588|nr:autotransporter outer membrane beta-barrel domain-containing protein [Erythrobacter sp. QSSC1-22B]OBX18616.1 hypothetical protein A9995_11720 [Erythrobacter sp. QSSC1-22B]